MEIVQYIIIALVLILVALAIVKSHKKDYKMEANKLVEYLGGKNNIVKYEVNVSRFLVEVKDPSIVNKDSIQKMGAQGIVEIDNELKIIFGDEAKQLKKYIDDLK
ncbi:MAG: PTS transporter subunit EIIB [Bacilli bacterium]|nr:PTS transporter subunit EIIB [Bacilli bacterium]